MNYDVIENCVVAISSYSNGVVMLTATVSRSGLSRSRYAGRTYRADDRLECAAEDAARVLSGWAAVGELGVAQIFAGWDDLPS